MNRKEFVSLLLPLSATFSATASTSGQSLLKRSAKIPPALVAGNTIGITSPAGHITFEEIQPSVLQMQNWGFNIKIGNTIGKKDFIYGGNDEERALDLQSMLDDKNVKAIMCARGGYGLIRIIDKLNFRKFQRHPKWIIGFSDITVIHSHIHTNLNIATIHSKMCNSFPSDWALAEPIQKDTIESIRQSITGEKMQYAAPFNQANRMGSATGQLIGGNLATLVNLSGSPSSLQTKRKILFVEDTTERLYSIDRMFWNMQRSGQLKELSGLLIGGFKLTKDDEGKEFGKTVEEIVLEKVKDYKYPVCFDFPVGHQKNNYALKCGVFHNLVVNANQSFLAEI